MARLATDMPPPILTVVMPAFNEAWRIGASLRATARFFASQGIAWELVVVDDGSVDGTASIVQAFAEQGGSITRLLRLGTNRGKGVAVRHGIRAAAGRLVLMTDTDLSAPIPEATKLLAPILAGECDVSVGSRGIDRSLILRRQAAPRDLLGRSFNVAVRVATGLTIRDTQCGFKAFVRRPLLPLVEASIVSGFGFDVELLGLCAAAGLRLREVGVAWRHADGSKVRVLRDGVGMLAETAGFVRRLRRGYYDNAIAAARAAVSR